MVDTLLFHLLALALSLLPPSLSEARFDLVDPAKGEIVQLRVKRTADGFQIDGAGDTLTATLRGRTFAFGMPGDTEQVKVDLAAVTAAQLSSAENQVLTIAEQQFQVAPSGAVRYVMAEGRTQMIVAHIPAAAAASVRMTGTLRVHEVPQTMSVKAWLANEFTLERPGLPEVALSPSATVSRADLIAQDGQTVEVEGVTVPAPAPNPEEAYPMGPDGKPLERDPSFEVRAMRAVKPGK